MGEPIRGPADPFSPVARQFARFLEELNGEPCPELRLAALLVSRAVEAGHVCLDLGAPDAVPGVDAVPARHAWIEALRGCPVVGEPGAFAPLVLDRAGRLYLHRYWEDEQRVARFVRERTARPAAGLDETELARGLSRLFPGPDGVDWQRVAAVAAVSRAFCVVSGGPGTGKTFTVVKVLALLAGQRPHDPLRIALAAPTGKAASRLEASIRQARDALAYPDDAADRLPDRVQTLHRLLGASPDGGFRHGAGAPLPHDVVVVDEASMVALPLMARLVDALRPGARLILVGDHHQLASVEAGAVLGDICSGARAGGFSAAFRRLLARVGGGDLPGPPAGEQGGLRDGIVVLERNYRFGRASGIHAVSRAVQEGDPAAVELLASGRFPDASLRPLPAPPELEDALRGPVSRGYGPVARAAGPGRALDAFGRFRVLCAVRWGEHGVGRLAARVERLLEAAGWIRPRGTWYPGRPVLVTRNDDRLGLYNGDAGIASVADDGGLRVFFPSPDGGLRAFSPARIPAHETAYATSVHKSQRSEFDRVLLVLPDRDAPVLTRELFYTAITRARSSVEVWATTGALHRTVARRVQRASGLREALWG